MKANQTQTATVRSLLEGLYAKARGAKKYEPQPYSKWNKQYAERLSESFGVKIILRAGRSKIRGATLSITTGGGRAPEFEITVYENQPGNLEHEVAHYIEFGLFGSECRMDRRNYAIEEIRAESTAYVMSMLAGNTSREARSVPYIRRYMADAGVEPEELIPNIEARVAEFDRRGIVPPKYRPIDEKPRYKLGRCGSRRKHVFECGSEIAECAKCGTTIDNNIARLFGTHAPTVA